MPGSYTFSTSTSTTNFYRKVFFISYLHALILGLSLFLTNCQSNLPPEQQLEKLWKRLIVEDLDKKSTLKLCKKLKNLAQLDSVRFADYLVAASAKASTASYSYKQWENYLWQGQEDCKKLRSLLSPQMSLYTWVLLDYEEARLYDSKGELVKAQDRYERIWYELERMEVDSLDAKQFRRFQNALPISLAGIHQFLGNYKLAEDWLEKADPIIDWKHAVYPGIVLGLRAQILQAKGDIEAAIEAYEKANQLFLKNSSSVIPGHYVENCMFYSELLLDQNLTSTAKAVLKQAARQQINGDRYPIYLSLQLAKIALVEGHFRKAYQEAELALGLSQQVIKEKYYWHARIFKVLAEIGLAEQEWQLALKYAQRGLDQFSKRNISKRIQLNPALQSLDNKLDVLPLLILKAQAILERYKAEARPLEELEWALETFTDAFQLVRNLRAEYEDDEVKEFLAASSFQLFEPAIETAYLLFQKSQNAQYLQEGLKIAETSRSLSLQENLKAKHAQQLLGIPEKTLQEERALKYQISKLEKELQHFPEGSRKQEGRHLLASTRAAYLEWQERISETYPTYYRLKYAEEALYLDDIQTHIAKEVDILSFFWGIKHIYCFRLAKGQLNFTRINQSEELQTALEDFRGEITSRRGGTSRSRFKKMINSGYTIYQQLLQPLEPLAKNLLVVSDGPLQYIPLTALPTKLIDTEKPKEVPYLIYDKTIRRIFSLAVWLRKVKTESTSKQSNFQGIDSLLVLAPANFPDSSQLSLQADGLEEVIGKKVRMVDVVNKERAKELLQRDYKYVLVFSHAAASEVGPYIQLSNDSLHLDEIYHTEMGTAFIVLGACETGLGENRKGEGILSLGRAFIYQNVENAAMTLWKVQDGPALRIAQALLSKHINEGLEPADALRLAQIEFLEGAYATGLPYQWAGFVLTGQ